MSIVLGIETATSVCAAAVCRDGVVVAESRLDVPGTPLHARRLFGLIEGLLGAVGLTTADLDAIAVSAGPGSFTGLRIGLSSAKGLCFATDRPLVLVPTLAALAHTALDLLRLDPTALICPTLDARRDEVYTALYRLDGDSLTEVIPPGARLLSELAADWPTDRRIIVTGDGAAKTAPVLAARADSADVFVPSDTSARASTVALIGARKFARGETADLDLAEPMYLKDALLR